MSTWLTTTTPDVATLASSSSSSPSSSMLEFTGVDDDNCTSSVPAIEFLTARFIAPAMALIAFNLVVVVGNSLVVLAVFTTRKLRTVTNMFIVSLACADLLLGVCVLPYSSANELLRRWPFGSFICNAWLAVDVWASTASIFNLCAISFDRYLAIGYPFRYPALMVPRRGRLIVAGVWIVSFLICFPPLIGWKESGSFGSSTLPGNCSGGGGDAAVAQQCALTSEPGYVIYSALGSFWIPMCVMVFFYWRIYRTAVRTMSALKRGVLTTKAMHQPSSSTSDEQSVTLRVHRGGTVTKKALGSAASVTDISGVTRLQELRQTQQRQRDHAVRTSATLGVRGAHHPYGKVHMNFGRRSASSGEFMLLSENGDAPVTSPLMTSTTLPSRAALCSNGCGASSPHATVAYGDAKEAVAPLTRAGSNSSILRRANTVPTRGGKISNLKLQLKRMNKEMKAAKTLGIIVGCFICCWLPFFTVYLLGAFCADCIDGVVFTAFFWLGYCNSAMNPVVYALFSRDFRYAFKKLVRCRCHRKKMPPRTNRFIAILNSIRFQVSSNKNSDSVSE